VILPQDIKKEQILFRTTSGLSNSMVHNLEYIVYVDPRIYDKLDTFEKKLKVANVVNLLNKHFSEKRYALMGPGRWGSNDINLGVQVTYSSINNSKLLVEIAFAKEGYTPEVSYGTHFFQDLVEADIAMVPIFPDNPGSVFQEDFLVNTKNILKEIFPEVEDCENVVKVIHVPSVRKDDFLQVYLDMDHQVGLGFFGPKQEVAGLEK